MIRILHSLRHHAILTAGLLFVPLLVASTTAAEAQTGGVTAGFPEVVARVDGHEIRRAELLAQAEIMRRQMVRAGQGDPAGSLAFYRQVLDALIGEYLVYADLEERGRTVSAAEVDEALSAMAERAGGRSALAAELREQGTDLESLRRQLRQSLTIEHVLTDDVARGITIDEATLRQVYDNTSEARMLPERHKVRHILKRLPPAASAAEKARVEGELLSLRQQVLDGADFAALARDHSDDVQSRERGGELPWVMVSDRSSDFERAAAALGTVGQLSEVVESPAGLHLIQLVDRQPARQRSFDEVRGTIAERLKTLRVRDEILQRVERLRAAATIEILI